MPDRFMQEIVTDQGVKVYGRLARSYKNGANCCQAKIHALTSQSNEDDREVSPDLMPGNSVIFVGQ